MLELTRRPEELNGKSAALRRWVEAFYTQIVGRAEGRLAALAADAKAEANYQWLPSMRYPSQATNDLVRIAKPLIQPAVLSAARGGTHAVAKYLNSLGVPALHEAEGEARCCNAWVLKNHCIGVLATSCPAPWSIPPPPASPSYPSPSSLHTPPSPT